MTRDEVKKIVMTIDVIYPNWNPKDLTFLVNAWTTMLIDYTYEDIERALRTFVATDQKGFAPTVGQLINCVHVTIGRMRFRKWKHGPWYPKRYQMGYIIPPRNLINFRNWSGRQWEMPKISGNGQ